METSSALLALCAGNSSVTGEFPSQRPVTRSFDDFFDLRLNKQSNKQSWGWWFETPLRSSWRDCNVEWCQQNYSYNDSEYLIYWKVKLDFFHILSRDKTVRNTLIHEIVRAFYLMTAIYDSVSNHCHGIQFNSQKIDKNAPDPLHWMADKYHRRYYMTIISRGFLVQTRYC